jgi:hypothetical protein
MKFELFSSVFEVDPGLDECEESSEYKIAIGHSFHPLLRR